MDRLKRLFWAGFRYYCKQLGIQGDKEEKLLRRGLEDAYKFTIKDNYGMALNMLIEEAHSQVPAIDMTMFQKKLWEILYEEDKD